MICAAVFDILSPLFASRAADAPIDA